MSGYPQNQLITLWRRDAGFAIISVFIAVGMAVVGL
ncbi:hypothetical protein EIT02_23480 [Salmonella enterica]|nr:hypothetical protein [Salmonella enterica]EBP3841543.1 hypothetical protein [Salmonella enterica subsp. enterica]ECU4745549.1 hypothetical protein [Salmonella enterica subsp. enterica serovar Berta]EAR2380738.1 hypothetical protein [Salmonella enterica]EAR5693862.1 hypothetical protein [Salmonella enterica]